MEKRVSALKITAIVLALVILGGLSVCFFVRPIRDSIKLALIKPSKLYSKAEKEYFSEGAKSFGAMYSKVSDVTQGKAEAGYNTSLKIILGDQLIKDIGVDGLESVAVESNVAAKDSLLGQSYSLIYNDKNVVTVDTVADLENEIAYIKVPELSDAYVSVSTDDIETVLEEYGISLDDLLSATKSNVSIDVGSYKQEILDELSLTEEDIKTIIQKYSDLFIESTADKVEKETVKDDIDGVEYKYAALKVEITYEDLFDLGEDYLKEFKNDKIIKDFFVNNGEITEEEYEEAIDQVLEALKGYKDDPEALGDIDLDETIFTITTYVNADQKVMGKEMEIEAEGSSFSLGYITVDNDKNYAINAWIKADKDEIFSIVGSAKRKNGALTGKFECKFSDYGDEFECTLELEDYKVVDEKENLISGKIKFESEIDGELYNLVLDCSVKNKKQIAKFIVNIDKEMLYTLEVSYEKTEVTDLKVPGSNETIYDLEEIETYLENVDLDAFQKHLTDALGEELVDDIMNGVGSITTGGSTGGSTGGGSNYISEKFKYDFNNVKVVVAGKELKLPCPITEVNDLIVWEVDSIEAEDFEICYGKMADGKEDLNFYVVAANPDENNSKPIKECVIETIKATKGASTEFSINGIKVGSTIEEVNAAFNINIPKNIDYIYINDSADTFNYIYISFSDGVVRTLEINYWTY